MGTLRERRAHAHRGRSEARDCSSYSCEDVHPHGGVGAHHEAQGLSRPTPRSPLLDRPGSRGQETHRGSDETVQTRDERRVVGRGTAGYVERSRQDCPKSGADGSRSWIWGAERLTRRVGAAEIFAILSSNARALRPPHPFGAPHQSGTSDPFGMTRLAKESGAGWIETVSNLAVGKAPSSEVYPMHSATTGESARGCRPDKTGGILHRSRSLAESDAAMAGELRWTGFVESYGGKAAPDTRTRLTQVELRRVGSQDSSSS
jgi:hypothetical protein